MARFAPTAAVVLALCALALGSGAVIAQSQSTGEMFDPEAEARGITISREACAVLEKQETAVWVEADGQSACLRYYASGLAPAAGRNPIVAAWLHGDIMGATEGGADKHQKGLGVAAMIAQERTLSQRFGVPFIFLARPGAYGSSGRHFKIRGRPIEAALIQAQLDALKARYGIGAWVLAGHSGGGTLVAEMLAHRNDIRCAVISSGASAFRAFLEAGHYTAALDHPENWFDPSTELDHVAADPARRIFVIGDPRDSDVPFATQEMYFQGLKARGLAAWLVPLMRGSGERHHDLMDFAETAAGMCARGDATDDIIDALKAMPDPAPRISN
jgi:pimeloyl-ACP methyl ester carboxylesterase